jgi:hypothetical protein
MNETSESRLVNDKAVEHCSVRESCIGKPTPEAPWYRVSSDTLIPPKDASGVNNRN